MLVPRIVVDSVPLTRLRLVQSLTVLALLEMLPVLATLSLDDEPLLFMPGRPANARTQSAGNVLRLMDSAVLQEVVADNGPKQLNVYHNVRAEVAGNLSAAFLPAVLFDTVNIQYDDGSEDAKAGLEYVRTLLPQGRGRDRRRLSTALELSPEEYFLRLLANKDRSRDLLPLPPHLQHVSTAELEQALHQASMDLLYAKGDDPVQLCSLNREHAQFRLLYEGREAEKHHVFHRRRVLVYISGRKHTWVALDWAVRRLLANGDTLVVVGAITHTPRRYQPKSSFHSRYLRARLPGVLPSRAFLPHPDALSAISDSDSDDLLVRELEEAEKRNQPQHVMGVANDIMEYVFAILGPELVVRVAVELVVGDTKHVLQDMYSHHRPHMVVCSAKMRKHMQAPIKTWRLHRLTDRLVKNFPLPVMVVPAVNMGGFETHLFGKLARGEIEVPRVEAGPFSLVYQPEGPGDSDSEEESEDEDDAGSIHLDDSINLDTLGASTQHDGYVQVLRKLKTVLLRTRAAVAAAKAELCNKDPLRVFAAELAAVSDVLLSVCREIQEYANNGEDGNEVRRHMTNMSYVPRVLRVKLMLDPMDEPPRPPVAPSSPYLAPRGPSTIKFYQPLSGSGVSPVMLPTALLPSTSRQGLPVPSLKPTTLAPTHHERGVGYTEKKKRRGIFKFFK